MQYDKLIVPTLLADILFELFAILNHPEAHLADPEGVHQNIATIFRIGLHVGLRVVAEHAIKRELGLRQRPVSGLLGDLGDINGAAVFDAQAVEV